MEVKAINTQRILSPTQISLADYVINPYRGCEFGCVYCYSQSNKNLKKDEFFRFLGIKLNAISILERELKYKKPKRVLLGSTTECFQNQEIKHKLTKKILELLNAHSIPYTILTKSHLIRHYLDTIAENKENKIYFTLNFHSNNIIRAFELNSSLLQERLTTIREIVKNKIILRIHAGPFVPFVSSLEEIFKIIPKETNELGVELYHNKQGNFKKVLLLTERHLGEEVSKKLKSIYKDKTNYLDFADKLKSQLKSFAKTSQIKTFFTLADFNEFYLPSMNYEKSLF